MTRKGRPRLNANASVGEVYRTVAMGGTFDAFHNGHKKLLKKAFAVGREVMIGVTTDAFAKSLHKPHKIDLFTKRKSDLESVLRRWGVLPRARIVALHDRYGPTLTSSRIGAIVVSRRTIRTAYEINTKRRARGLKPLDIVPIPLVLADDRRPISSTRIRRGRIDRRGRLMRSNRAARHH